MKPGIDPKVDYAFKKVFGSEANADLLQLLLEAVLGFPLSAVEIINPFNDKDASDDKLSVLDVKARDAAGRWFDVEMQTRSHPGTRPRLLYYLSRLYADQLGEGQDFTELRPAYSICFAGTRMFAKREDVYHNAFGLVDGATGETFSDHLGLHVLELPKFALGADDLKTMKEKWCYFLKHAAALDTERMPATMADPPLMKAMEVLMKLSQSAQERDRYENRLKWERDLREFEKEAREEGLKEGRDEGRDEGLKEGRDEGRKEGLKEGIVGRVHFCQRLLKQATTPADQLAQMSLDDLRRLAEDLERQLLPASP